jgi:hypothetical protein
MKGFTIQYGFIKFQMVKSYYACNVFAQLRYYLQNKYEKNKNIFMYNIFELFQTYLMFKQA